MVRRGSACSQECLGSLACPCPRGPAVSHTACCLMLSGGSALPVPNWEPHTAPLRLIPALKCLLHPSGSSRAVSLPPPKCTPHPVDALALLLCTAGIPPEFSWLRDGSEHYQGQEVLIPIQERICRVWFYLSHSSGQSWFSCALVRAPLPPSLSRGWQEAEPHLVSSLSGCRFLL